MDEWLDRYDIEVELTLLPREESGRHTPLYPGYRAGHVRLDGRSWAAVFKPKGRELVERGETHPFLVAFYRPDELVGRLHIGKEFFLEEGGWNTGRGTITAMLNFDAHVEEYLRRKAERDKRGVPGAESAK